ncbi:MAG: recombinase family protein [Nanoarchaeota archaeon]|nr:recombinase family protein [Nanoarchaeota archaeon]MBU1027933.1 recombinase family protein [Nanoarchaeota archaeon]
MKKRVALYLRVSTDEQAKHGISLEAQLKKLQDYCEFKDWEVFKVYKDEGISGSSIKKRKAFKQMLEESKEGKFSAIIVTKIDRAFRNTRDALNILEDLGINKIDFVSVGEDIDTTTAMGKAMFTMVSAFAQLEREMNVGRVKDVRQMRFDKGMFPARSPFGYKPLIKDKKIVSFKIDRKQAEIVSGCFKMTSEGHSYSEICKNYKIKPQSYYNIIKNKVYCGFISFEGEERKGIHSPIISEELYKKCQLKK